MISRLSSAFFQAALILYSLLLLCLPTSLWAGAALSWNTPVGYQEPWVVVLQKIMNSMTGPVAYACAGIAIVMAGLSMAFLDLQSGARKFVQAALGISIAFGATTLLSNFFTVPNTGLSFSMGIP